MSGDVQPRKRKDKKRKKDELGIEEPRGTAAALGEGDVFMHSQSEHGTGGHWCAKIIFFSLLAILITLIGLIILENRGLSELEANSVETRYSGVLEGWLEDAPDDDHHDEHTLELNHHDEEEHEEEEADEHEESEIEKLEKEASDEDLEPVSTELPALPEEEDDDDKDEGQSDEKDQDDDEDDSGNEDEAEEDEEFLEVDDADEPPVEKITVPAGEPFLEVEEDVSSEQPPDTLEEEEEYEKRQEELRKQEEQASHMWLKLGVGAALLVATHAVVRRATREREAPEREETASRENTPPVGRRLTLIPEETSIPVRKVEEVARPVIEKAVEKVAPVAKSIPIRKQESEEEEEEPQLSEDEEEIVVTKPTDDKELYSEEEVEDIIEEEEEEEEIVPPTRELPKLAPTMTKKPEPESEPEEDEDPEDVEIIGDEQLEEELEEEGDEEEISDVDDAELLRRLEAKYGKLPEPERPGRQKDGGNSVDDLWPGEPADAYWRQQLDSAEQDLRQDWLD